MSVKTYIENLKMALLYDKRLEDLKIEQLRSIYEIMDYVYGLITHQEDLEIKKRIEKLYEGRIDGGKNKDIRTDG